MPRKNYKRRLVDHLRDLRLFEETEYNGSRLFDGDSDAASVGEIFQIVSDAVVSLPRTHPKRKLFKEANLNPFDPYDWDNLLTMFAEVHYEIRKPGRAKQQDSAFRRALRQKAKQILRERRSPPNVEQLALAMLNKHGSEYPTIKSISGMRRVLVKHRATTGCAPLRPRRSKKQ